MGRQRWRIGIGSGRRNWRIGWGDAGVPTGAGGSAKSASEQLLKRIRVVGDKQVASEARNIDVVAIFVVS